MNKVPQGNVLHAGMLAKSWLRLVHASAVKVDASSSMGASWEVLLAQEKGSNARATATPYTTLHTLHAAERDKGCYAPTIYLNT